MIQIQLVPINIFSQVFLSSAILLYHNFSQTRLVEAEVSTDRGKVLCNSLEKLIYVRPVFCITHVEQAKTKHDIWTDKVIPTCMWCFASLAPQNFSFSPKQLVYIKIFTMVSYILR